MKKILLILFITCFSAQFLLAQVQTRLTVAPLDSNVTCSKATVIPHTFNKNEFLIDSFANKGNPYTLCYYSFIAKTKSGKIRIYDLGQYNSKPFGYIEGTDSCGGNIINGSKTLFGYNSLSVSNLIIGKKYFISLFIYTKNYKFKIIAIANKKDDNAPSSPTSLTSILPYSFNLLDYSYGRERNYDNSCTTSKADSNVVTVFVKFKATSTSATLDLNLNNASLESTLSLTSDPYTCQPIQSNKNLRTDTFTGLTIGNEYTVRIEIGGDTPLGYARTATENNASITLVGGTTTGIENDLLSTLNVYPNPTSGVINFTGTAQVFDLLGNKIAEGTEIINLENAEKGIYVIKIGEKVGKIVKQ